MNNMNFPPNDGNNGGQQNGGQQYSGQQYGGQQYGGQQYGAPQNGMQPPMRPQMPTGKGYSVAALVLGICSAFFSMFLASAFPISLIFFACGIIGIAMGVVGRKKSIACFGRPSGLATAGFVLSIIGTSLSGIFILSCVACIACIGAEVGSIGSIFSGLF